MYQCQVCHIKFDIEEESLLELAKKAKDGNGVARGVTSCPNDCVSFVIGVEYVFDGYDLFSSDVSSLVAGKDYPALKTVDVKEL